ncbi:hypothetical protein chiPu_0023390 [Chiloscyllium punctatum]|uniref:Uncharacterized protein n=1 Tax=Chiloscyllium punctatum TaxID=137246 RepID=A0A401TAF1_CHIPU|nr:hypothetical protein [Chiloscyllium punctatum]
MRPFASGHAQLERRRRRQRHLPRPPPPAARAHSKPCRRRDRARAQCLPPRPSHKDGAEASGRRKTESTFAAETILKKKGGRVLACFEFRTRAGLFTKPPNPEFLLPLRLEDRDERLALRPIGTEECE